MKAFPQFTREYIREDISYENLLYLISTIPPYRGLEDKGDTNKAAKPAKPKRIYTNVHEFFQA